MVLILLSQLLASVGVITLCFIWVWGYKHWQSVKGLNLPPGPSGLSAIFDSIFLLRCYRRNELQRYLDDRIRTLGPVFKTFFLGSPLVFLDSPDGNKFMASNDGDFKEYFYYNVRRVLVKPQGLHCMSPERRRKVKSFLAACILGPDCVPDFIHQSEILAKNHIQEFWLDHEDGTVFNVSDLIACYFSDLLAKQLLSLNDDQGSRTLQRLMETVERTIISFVPLNLPGTAFHRCLEAREELTRMVEAALLKTKRDLKDGRASPNQDILSRILTRGESHDMLSLTDEEISTLVVDLLLTGNMSTAKLITTVIRDVGNFDKIYENLISEHEEINSRKTEGQSLNKQDLQSMGFTARVVQESLRMSLRTESVPPVIREALKSLDYKGYTIPKGWKVFDPVHTSGAASNSLTAVTCELNLIIRSMSIPPSSGSESLEDGLKSGASSAGIGSPWTSTRQREIRPWEMGSSQRRGSSILDEYVRRGVETLPGEEYVRMNVLVFLHCFLTSVGWENVGTQQDMAKYPLMRDCEVLVKVRKRLP